MKVIPVIFGIVLFLIVATLGRQAWLSKQGHEIYDPFTGITFKVYDRSLTQQQVWDMYSDYCVANPNQKDRPAHIWWFMKSDGGMEPSE